MKSAVIISEETTIVNNNFNDEVSVVNIEVNKLAAKLEQDGALSRFMMQGGPCDCKAGQHLDDASISTDPTEVMTASTVI